MDRMKFYGDLKMEKKRKLTWNLLEKCCDILWASFVCKIS